MGKHILLIAICISTSSYILHAQQTPKQAVIDFFEAFHKQDTTALRSLSMASTELQSIHKDDSGQARIKTSTYTEFLSSIASIPQDASFKEMLLDYEVNEDDLMANVWTPYQFFYNGALIHCGVNSFQLIKQNDTWKIFYIVDTRITKNCKD